MNPTATRRRFLEAAFAGGMTGLAGCGSNPAENGSDGDGASTTGNSPETTANGGLPDAVGLETLAEGLQMPLDIDFAPGADRRYVAERTGVIRVHESGGLRDEPFLDLRDAVEVGGEKGLLGLALHPEFEQNRRLFVRYSAPPRSGTPSGYSHTFVLAEFEATADGRRAKRDTERTVLEIPEPQSNHNAGDIVFGPDDYLYVGVGDGGGSGDRGRGHVEDWYGAVDGGNGQDVTENLLGSVLRIDVDDSADGRAYAVPEDNPLVGRPGRDEHYAWGLRNPWRLSFDGTDLFVGDVGEDRYEEVDLIRKGGNYGWNVKEGTHCYGANDCPDSTPEDVREGEPLVDPIVEYPHSGASVSGISIIGGYVYRGSALPALEGRYVFGDLNAEDRLFVATRPEDGGRWAADVVPVAASDRGKLDRILSFGRDADGEVYALGSGDDDGVVHRIVPAN